MSADMARAARRKRPPEVVVAAGNQPVATAAAEQVPTKVGTPPAAATPQAATSAQPVGPEETLRGPMVSNEKPVGELTVTDRRARSIANLEKISQALAAYVKANKQLPGAATHLDGTPLLSWRVALLPYLGYADLYKRFEHEPWDNPTNKALIDYIPPEYQSPERFDSKTNYLAVVGPQSAFFKVDGVALSALKDGPDNTVAVIEVDDQYAEIWTQPSDFMPRLDTPTEKLFGLRGEGAFAVLASGRVVLLPKDLQPSKVAALLTGIGGEPVAAATFLKGPTAEPPPPTIANVADDPTIANQPQPAPDAAGAVAAHTPAEAAVPRGFPGSVPYVADVGKQEVPDEESLARARESLKELYGKDFQQVKTIDERQAFARTLLADAPNVEQNASDYHELVRIARDMAAATGDVTTALAACGLLEERYQLDPFEMRLAVLQNLGKLGGELKTPEPALAESLRLLGEAFESDRYDVALPLAELAAGFARALSNRNESTRLTQLVKALEDARALYVAAVKAFEKIQANPADPAANEAVGRYLCLVKNRWEAGLPYLNKSADIRLRGIGSMELSPDRTPHETLALAEQYWDLAGRFKQPQRRGLHLRAVYCYALVQPRLASSLDKIKVAKRMNEAVVLYGQAEIDRVIAPLKPAPAAVSQSEN